jgi:GTP-binding protein
MGYGKFEGEMDGRKNGALISMSTGKAGSICNI